MYTTETNKTNFSIHNTDRPIGTQKSLNNNLINKNNIKSKLQTKISKKVDNFTEELLKENQKKDVFNQKLLADT